MQKIMSLPEYGEFVGNEGTKKVTSLIEKRRKLYEKRAELSKAHSTFFEDPIFRNYVTAQDALESFLITKFSLTKEDNGIDCD
jgi:hypothetical protein